eukprot:COSAG01_NODE_418_length_17279_cov_69.506228_12_plen_279_part_00
MFVDKQDTCDELFQGLLRAGYPCFSLHGGKDQADRDTTIADFKNGIMTLMVATSVAARGLDVKELCLVVNYDVPTHYEDYVHRCGRTGRAGRKGTAVTFITPEQERHAPDLIRGLKQSNKKSQVPKQLQVMADSYEKKRSAGTVVAKSGGFGGSGFKFNEEEAVGAPDLARLLLPPPLLPTVCGVSAHPSAQKAIALTELCLRNPSIVSTGAAERAAAEKERFGVSVRKEEKERYDEDGNLIVPDPVPPSGAAPGSAAAKAAAATAAITAGMAANAAG